MVFKFWKVLILINFNFKYVVGSSLVFVIDDTFSMGDDIAAVRVGASAIFRTVLKHRNQSQVENFILITFNDPQPHDPYHPCLNPGVIVRANTTERKVFQDAIDLTHAGEGNDDCPECAMAGIIKGIEGSNQKSNIYVFTDATAKDYLRYEELKKIALDKQSQVVFVLTGQCKKSTTSPKYRVYENIAKDTDGMVFNIQKNEVNKVLEYVKNTITGERDTIHKSKLQPGLHYLTFNADQLMGEILLSFTSSVHAPNNDIMVYAPDGINVPRKIVFQLDKAAVYSFNAEKSGPYTVQVNAVADTDAVVSAPSGVSFQIGFSTLNSLSIEDTSTRPAPGVKSHLLINLNKGYIELEQVKIMDLSGNVIQTLPLQRTNNKTNLYSTEAFVPPNTLFKIEVKGYHRESNSDIFRNSSPVASQSPPLSDKKKAPKVKQIRGGNKINVKNYGAPLNLTCEVEGYPKPNMVWKKIGDGTVLPSEIRDGIVYLQDYFNVLTIEKVTENATYECEASYDSQRHSQQVIVEVAPRRYLNITDASTNVTINYEEDGTIFCVVDAYPQADITWLKNDKKFVSSGNIEITSTDKKSTVAINKISLADRGKYTCEAKNEDTVQRADMLVTIGNLIPATITTKKNLDKSSIVDDIFLLLPCKAQGFPKPEIKWFFQSANASIKLQEIDYTNINDERILNHKRYSMFIESPSLGPVASPPTYIERGESAEIKCPIPHNNTDLVRWFKNDKLISTGKLSLNSSSLAGHDEYIICRVSTPAKSYSKTIKVIVENAPTFVYDDYEKNVTLDSTSPINLNCETYARPDGTNEWFYNGKKLNNEDAIYDFSTKKGNPGEYRCEVRNKYGNVSRTFYVTKEYCLIDKSTLASTHTLAPVTLDSLLSWLELDNNTDENIISIPNKTSITWFCPSKFKIQNSQTLVAYCVGGSNFQVSSKIFDYSEIKCKEKVKHDVKLTNQVCNWPKHKFVNIGYNVIDPVDTIVYKICFDTINKVPIYAKHIMLNSFAGNDFYVDLVDKNSFDIDFEEAYDCNFQKRTIMDELNDRFHNEDSDCFKKRQLVSPKDVFPGVPQRATYSYYNVLPQWSTYSENWDEIETRVRKLVKDLGRSLIVWTGTANVLHYSKPIVLYKNDFGTELLAPLYWWKVVQDPVSSSSLAIIQVNHPDLNLTVVSNYTRCKLPGSEYDLCYGTGWMENKNWAIVENGYTYCCSIADFEEAFDFKGTFERGLKQLLKYEEPVK